MATNNDLGSLSYSLNIDISQLPDTIRNVEKQLSGISTVADISTRVDSNQLIGAIKQALMAEDFKLKVSLDESFRDSINKSLSLLNSVSGNTTGSNNTENQIGYIDSLILKLKELEAQYKALPKGADTSALISEFRSIQTELDKAGKNLSSAFNKSWEEVSKMSETTISDIKNKIKSLEQYKLNIPIANKNEIEAVNKLIAKLKGDINSLTKPIATKNFGEVMGMDTATLNQISDKLKEIRRLRAEINVNEPNGLSRINSLNKAEADLLRIQQQRLGINKQINETYQSQSMLVDNLVGKAIAYFSIQKLEQFATKLIEIRGEFEKQQVALQVILQSKDQADRLFSQVVDLGLKSPFSIMQLNSYVKGLAAYRIETDQLFDTTKRLADISSGLGVEMGRLILAYGQVRAASVLRGQEVRQFTEAGIPLIEALADQFTKLEGRVVSTNEVFDKISNRLVPFEMVRDVLFEMTDAGGVFFNMQEKQAETLGAKWKNLQDAIDVMYNSIGQDYQGFLKGMAEGLTSLTENWRSILGYIESAITALGTYKALSIATGSSDVLVKSLMTTRNVSEDVAKRFIRMQSGISGGFGRIGMSVKALSASFKSFLATNGWMLLAAAIAGVAVKLYTAYQEAQRLGNELAVIGEEGKKEVEVLTKSHGELTKKIKEATDGTIARKEAIEQLNKQFGSYYGVMLTEANALQMIAGEYDNVNAKIKENSRLKGAEKIKDRIDQEYDEKINKGYAEFKNDATKDHNSTYYSKITAEAFDAIIQNAKQQVKASNDFSDKGIVKAIDQATKSYGLTKEQILQLNDAIYGKGALYDNIVDIFKLEKKKAEELDKALGALDTQYGDVMPGATQSKMDDFNKQMDSIDKQLESAKKEANNLPTGKENSKERMINEAEKKALQEKIALAEKYNWIVKKDDLVLQLKRITVSTNQIQKASEKLFGLDSKSFTNMKQMTSLEAMQGEYKRLSGLLENPKLYNTEKDKDGFTDIEKDKKKLEDLKKLANELDIDLDPKGSGKEAEDARLAKYKAEIALVKEANGAYKKYLDVLDESNAKAKVEENFAAQFKGLGIDIKYASDELAYYQSIADKLSKGTSKKDIALWNSVNKEIGGTQSEEEIETLKKQWKSINDLFDLKKEAYALRDMYMQKGVSKEVSESFVKQIYGDIPLEFDNFQEDVSSKLSDASGNWGSDAGKAFKKRFGQEAKNSFLEMLDKFQTTQQKINGINYKYTQIFKDLETQKGKISAEVYAGMVANAETAKAEELAAVTATAIQMTDAYQRMFGSISEMSEKELNYLIQKWKTALVEAKRNTDDTFSISLDGQQFITTEQQIASFTKKVLISERELHSKNPFKALQDSFIEFQKTNGLLKKTEEELKKTIDEIETTDSDKPELIDKLKQKIKELEDQIKKLKGESATTASKIATSISGINSIIQDLEASVISLFQSFGASDNTTETLESIMGIIEGLGDTASGVARITSGDIIGGLTQGVKGIAGVISSITSLSDRKHEKQIRRLQEAIDASKIAYEQLGRAAAKALGNAEYDTKKLQVAELKRQQQLIQGQIKSEKDKKKTDKDKIKNWEEEYRQLGYEIEDIITEITESLTGNIKDMANEMTNALVEAFEAGDDAQEAMFKSIKNNLKQTISKQFQKTVVESALEPLFERMNEMLGIDDQGNATSKRFTPEQVKELIGMAGDISEDVMDIFNSGGWKEIFDALTNSGELSGLSKGIQGLTEDTAQIIEAYLNTIRDVTISIMINSENQLSVSQASQLIQSQILTEVATMSSATVSMNNALRSVIAQSNGDNGAGIRVYIK